MAIFTIVMTIVSGLGIGTICGTLLNDRLAMKRDIRRSLYEARRAIYSKVLGTARNAVKGSGVSTEFGAMNVALSEAMLIAGKSLRNAMKEYGNYLTEMHDKHAMFTPMGKKEQNIMYKLIHAMEDEMMKELGVE